MIRLLLLVPAFWLAGCERKTEPAPDSPQMVAPSPTADNVAPPPMAKVAKSRAPKTEVEDFDSEVPGPGRPNLADSGGECSGSYCPCDTSDPDYGGADVPVCNLLSAGGNVDQTTMTNAANLRDARRQIREFNQQNGGGF